MIKFKQISILLFTLATQQINGQYNSCWITNITAGSVFNRSLKDTFAPLKLTGNQTITSTLLQNKGLEINQNK